MNWFLRLVALLVLVAAEPAMAQSTIKDVMAWRAGVSRKVLGSVASERHSLARARAQAGNRSAVMLVRLAITRDGRLESVRLERSSGFAEMDRVILRAIRGAAPFRPMPAHFTDRRIEFTQPIRFH